MPVLAAIGEGLVELEPVPGGDGLRLAPGGDAANVAVMAARIGAASRLAGRVGDDPFGSWLTTFWRDIGVDIDHVRTDRGAPTGLYLNTRERDGDHRFTYWRRGSAGSRLDPTDLDDDFFLDVGILVVTGVTLAVSPSSAATVNHALTRARSVGARIACVLNHRPALGGDPSVIAEVAARADVVVGSVEDAVAVFGDGQPEQLAGGPLSSSELVMTNGDEPVTAVIGGVAIQQAVPAVKVVNSAGAGDAFAGAYLAQRLAGQPPESALAWGVAASARSVSRAGCARSYPTLGETTELADRLLAA